MTVNLFPLEPLAIGTPKAESLASYVCRLAEAHSVSVASLCRHVIVPEIALEDHGKGLRYISSSGHLVNGSGKVAQDWLGAMSRLTDNVSLIGTNLIPLQEVVTPKQLFRKHAAWCPLCLEDRLESPDGPFESLAWSFRSVKYCPEHGWLSEICPYCAAKIEYFTANRRVGCCPDCLRWLGGKYISVPASLQREDPDIYRQISEIVGNLLADLPDLNARVTPESLSKGIRKAVLVCFDGTLTRFSEAIGKRKGAVSAWRSGTVTPSFKELARISCITGISLKGMLSGEFDRPMFQPSLNVKGLLERTSLQRRSYQDHEVMALEKALKESLGEILPRSISAICKDIGVPTRYAWKDFPDLAKAVSAKRRETLSHSQSQREESIKGEIYLVVADLHAKGVYPSLRKVTQRIGRKAKLRKDQNRNFWEREVERGTTMEPLLNLNKNRIAGSNGKSSLDTSESMCVHPIDT